MYSQLLLLSMADAINRSRQMADAALAGNYRLSIGIKANKRRTGSPWIVKARAWMERLGTRRAAPRPEPVAHR